MNSEHTQQDLEIANPQAISPLFSLILDEHDVPRRQRDARIGLLEQIEKKEYNSGKKAAVIAMIARLGSPGSSIGSDDIPPLGSLLKSIGDVDILNLILHSPGGDGTCVEKIVALCRAQCKTFRVIIPHKAKSAATMIALGADEIIMGHSSEIGPIDAQVGIVHEGLFRFVSAQSFIDAKETLQKEYADLIKAKKDTGAVLQQLATLHQPFIQECKRMMDFGRDVSRNLLRSHMFRRSKNPPDIDAIVNQLSSVQVQKIHGRAIDGPAAKRMGLNVKLLAKDDKLWTKIWEYYTRSEINLGPASKLFESRHAALYQKNA
jgi:hypothetical protein